MHFCLVVRWNTLNIQDQHTLILWSGVNDSMLLDGLSLNGGQLYTRPLTWWSTHTQQRKMPLSVLKWWCFSPSQWRSAPHGDEGVHWPTDQLRRGPMTHILSANDTPSIYIESCLICSAFPKLHILLNLKATDNNCVAMPLISHPYWYRFCHPHCHTLKIPCFYSSTGW